MTRETAIEILKKEAGCRREDIEDCTEYDGDCNGCPYRVAGGECLDAIDKAIEIMEGQNNGK